MEVPSAEDKGLGLGSLGGGDCKAAMVGDWNNGGTEVDKGLQGVTDRIDSSMLRLVDKAFQSATSKNPSREHYPVIQILSIAGNEWYPWCRH